MDIHRKGTVICRYYNNNYYFFENIAHTFVIVDSPGGPKYILRSFLGFLLKYYLNPIRIWLNCKRYVC